MIISTRAIKTKIMMIYVIIFQVSPLEHSLVKPIVTKTLMKLKMFHQIL